MGSLRNLILAGSLALAGCTFSEIRGLQSGWFSARKMHIPSGEIDLFVYTPEGFSGQPFCMLSHRANDFQGFDELAGYSAHDTGCDGSIEEIKLYHEDLLRSISYDPKTGKYSYIWTTGKGGGRTPE